MTQSCTNHNRADLSNYEEPAGLSHAHHIGRCCLGQAVRSHMCHPMLLCQKLLRALTNEWNGTPTPQPNYKVYCSVPKPAVWVAL
jgi:hypothetical protein